MSLPEQAYTDYLAIRGDILRDMMNNKVVGPNSGGGSAKWLRAYDPTAVSPAGNELTPQLAERYRFRYGTKGRRIEPSEVLHNRFHRMIELLKEAGYEP